MDVADELGLTAQHAPARPETFFFPDIMGGGVALLDFDNDGRLDVFLVGTGDPAQDGEPTDRLWRQQPDGRFVDVTAAAGVTGRGYGMGTAVGDVNNDGYPEIYVTNFGPDRLYVNQRDGTFVEVGADVGLDNIAWGASATFVDIDRDGLLDLFVTNYVDYDPTSRCNDGRGVEDYCSPQVLRSTSDRLYRNVTALAAASDGVTTPRFEDVSVTSGIALTPGAGLGVAALDVNGDHWSDIYVANDGEANHLWINRQDGTFRNEAIVLGAAYDGLGRGQAGMGVALGDLNRDDAWDLVLTHLDGESHAAYLSEPGGMFQDRAREWQLADASFPSTGFGTALCDLDLDGDLDLPVANGRVRRRGSDPPPEGGARWGAYQEANQLFFNEGEGFQEFTSAADGFVGGFEISRGLAVGDIDGDGDLDMLLTNIAGPVRVLRNDIPRQGHWLTVSALDPRYGSRHAYGAVVTVVAGDDRWQRLVNPGLSYLSSHAPDVHFGLGDHERIDAIEVIWPDGTSERFPGGDADGRRVVEYGGGTPVAE